MIKACRDYYRGNENELQSIDEFEKSYTSQDCIKWYTRETFVYKMVNKALRTEDVQQLHTFRFFIADLSSALARQHVRNVEEPDNDVITTVYRGVRVTLSELEEFRLNEGKLISINGYLSTSRSRSVAIQFTGGDKKRSDTVPVLFEIECRNEEGKRCIFADIAEFSNFPEEQEVLFDLGTVLQVETVSEEAGMWKVLLRTTSDGREIARQYIEETKKEMQEDSISIFFGSLLTRMGRYQGAQIYFQKLLKDPGNENVTHIHRQLGLAYQAKAEYDLAMYHFDAAYQLMRQSRPPQLRGSANVLRNMSHVLLEQGHYEKALMHCSKAKQVLEESNDSFQLELAHCLHTIGSSYSGQHKYTEALSHYEQALDIKRACLPENHVHIAETLNSIGLIYLMTNDIERALNFHFSSFEMYRTCLPEDHSDIANVLHNIADCYHSKNQLDKALQHYELALTMKKKCFPSGHPSIAATLDEISTVTSEKGDNKKALKLCLKALKIRQLALPSEHPDLAASLSSAGYKYEAMKDNQRALECFKKALEIRVKFLPEGDLLRRKSEKNVIRMRWKVG